MSSVSDLLRTPGPSALEPERESEETRTAARGEALQLIEEAEVLGIPWRKVLQREILAEGTLQRFLGAEIGDLPLWRALSVIPNTLFHSWRVRELVDRLCYDASAQGSRSARRELASLVACLSGPRARRRTEQTALAKHYWFAYQRVLELHAVALAAEKCRAAGGRRREQVYESTGCSRQDAQWAVDRLTSARRGDALDDAIARTREEGFEIPHGTTELQAFSRLRRFVRRHRLTPDPRPRRRPVSVRARDASVQSGIDEVAPASLSSTRL
jgi:hypothetical protein